MFSWDGSKNRKKNHDSFTPYNKGSNHGILKSLVKSSKEILATEKALKAFNSPPQMTAEGRTETRPNMQRMGIVVSNIHATIKFQTPNGVGTVYSSYNAGRVEDTCKKVRESSSKPPKVTLYCSDAEENVMISDLHPA
nr:reverse transcriptase domain-containing protein [Tanacetum cinerariifolium]